MNNYDFGNYLYELRSARNLSQTELAKMLGVTNKAVSKWETGAAYPSAKTMYPLAKALGVSIEQLYSAMGDDGKRKNILRRLLDSIFKYKKLTFALPLIVAVAFYVLFLIFGTIPDKLILAIITPLISAFVFGGVFMIFFIQLKNPMCPNWFLDVLEFVFILVFGISAIALAITFLIDLKNGFTNSLIIVLVSLSVISLVHNKRP